MTEYKDVMEKLSKILEDREDKDLSHEEVTVIREMMKAYLMFISWGKLGKFVIWFIITLAAVLTAINQIGATGR